MNRSLLAFSILLIIIGAVSQVYAVLVFGILFLFPAILTSPRPRPTRLPTSTSPQQRRVAPKPAPVQLATEPAPLVQSPTPATQQAPPTSQPNYSVPLFPTPMFPNLSLASTSYQPTKKETLVQSGSRDELLEVGAMLAILRLALA